MLFVIYSVKRMLGRESVKEFVINIILLIISSVFKNDVRKVIELLNLFFGVLWMY